MYCSYVKIGGKNNSITGYVVYGLKTWHQICHRGPATWFLCMPIKYKGWQPVVSPFLKIIHTCTHVQLCKDARLLQGRTHRPYRKLQVINRVTFIIGIMWPCHKWTYATGIRGTHKSTWSLSVHVNGTRFSINLTKVNQIDKKWTHKCSKWPKSCNEHISTFWLCCKFTVIACSET